MRMSNYLLLINKKNTDFGNEVKRVTSTDDNQGDDDGGNGGEMGQN